MARLAGNRRGGGMTALLVLVPLSLGMGLIGLGAFFWAMRRGQFEDPEGNAWRVIAPERPPVMEDNHKTARARTGGSDPGKRRQGPEDGG